MGQDLAGQRSPELVLIFTARLTLCAGCELIPGSCSAVLSELSKDPNLHTGDMKGNSRSH